VVPSVTTSSESASIHADCASGYIRVKLAASEDTLADSRDGVCLVKMRLFDSALPLFVFFPLEVERD